MKRMSVLIASALVLSILLMRAPVTCVGPVAESLRETLSVSYATYGVLSALPVLMFGLAGFAAPLLFSKLSTRISLGCVLSLLSVGLALRLIESLTSLLVGTLFIGAGIAVLNTVIPVVLRHYFPGNVSKALGIYTAATGCSSFVGALVAVPLLNATGTYAAALGIWVVFAVPAAMAWFCADRTRLPDLRASEKSSFSFHAFPDWFSKVPVVFTMSLQSLVVYALIAWLPTLLMSRGMDPAAAGCALSVLLIGAGLASLLIAPMIRLFGTEGRLSFVLTVLSIVPLLFLFLPGLWPFLACALLSVPHGARFSLALILISKSSVSLSQMLALSSISQGFGYILGALGPLLCASLYRGDGNWTGVLIFLSASCVLWGIAAIAGFAKAGKQ